MPMCQYKNQNTVSKCQTRHYSYGRYVERIPSLTGEGIFLVRRDGQFMIYYVCPRNSTLWCRTMHCRTVPGAWITDYMSRFRVHALHGFMYDTHVYVKLPANTTMKSSNWNLFRCTGLLWGESGGRKTSDAELWYFHGSAPEQTVMHYQFWKENIIYKFKYICGLVSNTIMLYFHGNLFFTTTGKQRHCDVELLLQYHSWYSKLHVWILGTHKFHHFVLRSMILL